jgi:hypothetical protein
MMFSVIMLSVIMLIVMVPKFRLDCWWRIPSRFSIKLSPNFVASVVGPCLVEFLSSSNLNYFRKKHLGGGLAPSSPNCKIPIDSPLAGKAGRENDLSIAPMNSTRSKNFCWLLLKVPRLWSKSHLADRHLVELTPGANINKLFVTVIYECS